MEGPLAVVALVAAVCLGVAGLAYAAKVGIDALDRKRGTKPKKREGQSDALVAFGGLAFIVGLLLVIGGEAVMPGVLIGALGVAMMLAWWVRRTSQESRTR